MRLASLRHSILTVLTCVAFPHVGPSAAEPLRLLVSVKVTAPHLGPVNSYGLAIANQTDHSIPIRKNILIQKRTSSGWNEEGAIEAIDSCDKFDYKSSSAMVRLEAHATMAVVPSDGWLCGEQCPQPCQQNVPRMPGIYRFVVVTDGDLQRIASPPFSIEWIEMWTRRRSDVHHEFSESRESYGLEIDNRSSHEISITPRITIWKKDPTGWSLQLGGLQAVSNCNDFDQTYGPAKAMRIASFGELSVVPWDGMMCGGQCEESCMKNFPLGPGTFRYEIAMIPDGTKIESPSFTVR